MTLSEPSEAVGHSPDADRLSLGAYDLVHEIHGRLILRGLNLEVEVGECVGLCGEPGSGKSLLLAIFAGLIRPLSGEIRYGSDLLDADTEAAPACYVPQSHPLDPRLTVEQWIEYRGACFGLSPATVAEGPDPLPRFGIESLRERPIDALSACEHALVCYAAEQISDQPVLLVDGLLDGLPESAVERIARFQRHELERGKAAVVTSSRESLLREVCDQVFFLLDGRLEAAR